MFATLCWSGNFIVGKFAYLFEVPPLTLNFLRWVSVWIILIPFTYKEIFKTKSLHENLAKLSESLKVNTYVREVIDFINHDKKRPICTPLSK